MSQIFLANFKSVVAIFFKIPPLHPLCFLTLRHRIKSNKASAKEEEKSLLFLSAQSPTPFLPSPLLKQTKR